MIKDIIKRHANGLSKALAFIIFAIIAVYYGVTMYNSSVMNKQMTSVSDHPYQVVVAIGDVKANLTLLRALPERMTYSLDQDVIEGVESHFEKISVTMDSTIAILQERYLADEINVPALQSTYYELIEEQNELITLAKSNGTTTLDIKDYFNVNIVPKLNKLDALAISINEGAGRKLNSYSSLVTTSSNTMTFMSTVLSVAVIFTIILYLYILHLKYKTEEEIFSIQSELKIEQRANAAKSQFLFNMSHDIRTPMNAIIGLTTIAAMDIDKKEKVKDCLTKISASSRQLLGLINDILDMSRIESGKISLNMEEFVLPDLIEDFITVTMPQATDKGLNMEVNASDISHECVEGDAILIKRMMINIIGNSLKFTPAGGSIWLTIRELPPVIKGYGSYQFIMRDTGIGMSEEFISKLFMPFERAENSTKSRVEGTGLGMAITKNIVDMMGGQIKVESELGKGTTFTINLPIKLQEKEAESLDYNELLDLHSLVVDDDEIACETTLRMIQEIGMCCEGVLSGKEAIIKVKNAHDILRDYHVVIVDWKMPEMDGLETTRKIREIVGDELPIIVLTAYDWADIEADAKEAGVNAFLSKPVFKSRLIHVMRDLSIGGSHVKNEEETILLDPHFEGRVLLVEDNEINMEIAEEFIQYFGVTVEKVWDGVEAVERIKEVGLEYYDLVFMDIQMPKMDGYEATQNIRRYEEETKGIHLPIVAMSANAFIEEVNRGYASGMDSYITKPVEMDKISNEFKKYLKLTSQ